MINAAILKQSVKKNYGLWLILTGVICFFASMIAYLAKVNPNFNLPGSTGGESLINIYAGAFYGMMGMMLFLIYAVWTGIKLVVSEVDHGDLAYTLNTPVSRKTIILTKASFLIGSILLMVLGLGVIGTIVNAILTPDQLDYAKFWQINAVLFYFLFAISGISFAASCWFNRTTNALVMGAGLPVLFFLFNVLAGLGSDFKFFKYFTLNTLFNPADIIAGKNIVQSSAILICVGIVLYLVGIEKFIKKDLPL